MTKRVVPFTRMHKTLPKLFIMAKDATKPQGEEAGGVFELRDEEKSSATPDSTAPKEKSDDAQNHESEPRTVPQLGVRRAEAMTSVWGRKQLLVLYILQANPSISKIWVVQFISTFANGVVTTLNPYVTSAFASHTMTPTALIVGALCSGIFKLPSAKLMDLWGRPQTLTLVVLIQVLGFIILAACRNVQTYFAGQVFYQVGYQGIAYSVIVIIADTSTLRTRGFYLAVGTSSVIATTWASGPAAQSILETIGFRWGFGIWAIVVPVTCAPLAGLLYFYQYKAEKQGLVSPSPVQESDNMTLAQKVIFYLREFDVVGVLMLSTGLSLFLLGLTLWAFQKQQWKSPMIICFLIFGGLLVIAFVLYERYVAPVSFMPWPLIWNRTIFFTCVMAASTFTGFYIWNAFFLSMLVAVWHQSTANATYITNIMLVGTSVGGIVVGLALMAGARLKYLALGVGMPLVLLGTGLLYHFNDPSTEIGYIIMTQIFISLGSGVVVLSEQLTVMAVSDHQHYTAVIAIEGLMSSIGAAFGLTIAASIWIGIFPEKLVKYMPLRDLFSLPQIVGDLNVQASFAKGTPERIGIDRSYCETQDYMLIASLCFFGLSWVAILFWRNVNMRIPELTKGKF
ncbi:hypothetical protein HRR88_008159 [Exophiala dermatitidis]|nr:hypothetical protein HRR75_008349 [Exophiala dermatitidis]KAJ4503463.1 hypothetical protein HRR73_009088 [Exophiala dermatitidis]KAJ4504065.1 hypothetical protein HRR74_009086 [Exophiala dermatitidis]KAJ4538225.1 hypothetical protein HRR78_008286 [Exophiala dermatitidis]KAJ4555930.1 hypothetical protein HRR79_009024 [Exophiala dermatitidis]